jgi:hypothetical protein
MKTPNFRRCSVPANVSSGTYLSAPVGQCFTQRGSPSQRSHRCATCVAGSSVDAPNGHAHTHPEQPMHFSAATRRAPAGPPSKVAPVGQANRQAGTSHCTHRIGTLSIRPSLSSDTTRNLARSGQQAPVWLRLQTISQIRQPVHAAGSTLMRYRMVGSPLAEIIGIFPTTRRTDNELPNDAKRTHNCLTLHLSLCQGQNCHTLLV